MGITRGVTEAQDLTKLAGCSIGGDSHEKAVHHAQTSTPAEAKPGSLATLITEVR